MAQSEKDYGRSSRQRNTLDPRNPGAHRRNSSDSDREAFNANFWGNGAEGYEREVPVDGTRPVRSQHSPERSPGLPPTHLEKTKTGASINISPEQFEKLFLSPQSNVKGELRNTFANPTPLALLGFLMSVSPLAFDLMRVGGAGGDGAANTGAYYFMGGLLMIMGCIGEFLLGNTFSFVVFGSYGGFWLTLGATLTPAFNITGAYSPDLSDPTKAYLGATSAGFYASYAYFLFFMALLSAIFLLASLRTNICFVIIFLTLALQFGLLAGGYWSLSSSSTAIEGAKLVAVAGSFSFMSCLAGWYIFAVQVLASVDFPISLPVGDLSQIFKGGADRIPNHMSGKETYSSRGEPV